jgi:hypothetical protein
VVLGEKMNNLIIDCLKNKTNVSFGKLGATETSFIYDFIVNDGRCTKNPYELFWLSGVLCPNLDSLTEFIKVYIDAALHMDHLIKWFHPLSDGKLLDEVCLQHLGYKNELFDGHDEIEPFLRGEEGWHYHLGDTKLLFVSPFPDTVAIQKEKYSEIWQGAPKPEVVTVRYPFAECYTGEEPKVVWQDRLAQMKEEIAKQDFDFATLGCGAMGLPLCKFIQNELGKGCIYLGGGNQLLFGIKGKRWEDNDSFKEMLQNPAWIRPLPNETPEGQTEGGAYF